MLVNIWNDSKQGIGGGWTFIGNLTRGLGVVGGVELTDSKEADIIFIPSSSMVGKTDEILELKKQGKRIVLRVDNATRDSRNRGAGMSRMKRLAEMADWVIYQSYWALDYLQPYLNAQHYSVIYNGIDTEVFKPEGARYDFGQYYPIYLYSRYNRDETKRWEKAWYDFSMIYRHNPNSKLVIVGQFSDELRQYNFDFFMGERFEYLGVIDNPHTMASVYRGCHILLAPYYNDCYSNTIHESLSVGLEVVCDDTGGNNELKRNKVIAKEKMAEKYKELFRYVLI